MSNWAVAKYEARKREALPSEIERLSREVVDATFKVHSTLGPGLLESAYEACLAHEIIKRNIKCATQISLPLEYDGVAIQSGYRIDLLVDDTIIVEIKSVELILPVHKSQLTTYLKLSKLKLGFLINFNVELIKESIHRFINTPKLFSE